MSPFGTFFIPPSLPLLGDVFYGWSLSKCSNHEEDCANFCGHLRKAELYLNVTDVAVVLRTAPPKFWCSEKRAEREIVNLSKSVPHVCKLNDSSAFHFFQPGHEVAASFQCSGKLLAK